MNIFYRPGAHETSDDTNLTPSLSPPLLIRDKIGYPCGMMNNNVFKKICIANHLRHFEIKDIFKQGGCAFSSSRIKAFMAGSQNKNYEKLSDEHLEGFLNGFIIYSRGPLDEPNALPRTIENAIIHLVETGNTDAIAEIRALIEGMEEKA